MKNLKKRILLLMLCLLSFPLSAQELEDYIRIAVENNAGLKAAYARFEAAMQKAPQVKSLPDPTLSLSAFGRMVETRLGPQEAKFSLMQMFPWFGTLEAKENQALQIAEAEFQAFLDARNELSYKVAQQYYLLYELEKSIEFQKENMEILDNYKDLSLAKVRSGSGALADVLRTDVMRNDAKIQVEILKLKKKPLLSKFYALLNSKQEEVPFEVPSDIEIEPAALPSIGEDNIDSNPRLKKMDDMISAAKAQEKVASKNGLPSIGLGVDYMVIGERTDMDPPGNGRDAIMPMVSVSLPIFRKKYKAARKEAKFLEESYMQEKKEIENILGSELESARFEAEKALTMLRLYEEQIESKEQILKLLHSSYSNSGTAFEEILQLRQELLQYQLEVAKAESTYFTALARISYLTGNSIGYEQQK